MKAITLCIRCFLFFILCPLAKAEIAPRRYTVDSSLENKVSNNSLMTKHPSGSLTECSAMCGELCGCLGFNPQQKKCRLHQSCDPSEMTGNEAGWRYFCPDDLPVDCMELHERGQSLSGVYQIHPTEKSCHAVTVYCDMVTSGGGWTAIQRRTTGNVDFNRTWNDYKFGFGIPEDYWIGNEAIHQLTKGGKSSLYIAITLLNGTTLYELYEQFYLTDEADKYRLIVDGPATGTLGDSLRNDVDSVISAGRPFSTLDQDIDAWGEGQCATYFVGGWWFNLCHSTFLNGQWNSTGWARLWNPTVERGTDVKGTMMMIKPR